MLSSHFKLRASALSDIGYVRKRNEDAWKCYPEEGFFILADGMGGQNSGDIAARECVDKLADSLFDLRKRQNTSSVSLHECEQQLVELIVRVNKEIFAHAATDPHLFGMGTTVCLAYIFEDKMIYAHVGDSRIYRYRKELQQLTQDHSLAFDLIASGELTEEEARVFPLKHVLTRAIGTNPTVIPTTSNCTIAPEDLFLLCSDGLTNYVSNKEIGEIFSRFTPDKVENAAEELVSLAKEHGGGDNITVILIYFDDLLRQ